MRTKLSLLICLLFFVTCFSYGQDCNCNATFQWLRKTFEENDAGFTYILSIKGQAAYDYHNKTIAEKINAVKTKEACLPVLQEWLSFFRKGHIYIQSLEPKATTGAASPVKALDTLAIKNRFKDWPRLQLSLPEFEQYLGSKSAPDFEGIWESLPYKIAIKKTSDGYKGILLNNVPPYWEAGQVKLEIKTDGGKWKGILYLRDHTKVENDDVQAIGQNYAQVASLWLKRLAPALTTEEDVQDFFKMQNARSPYMKQLGDSTLYFRIPSFELSQKKAIDSVLSAYKDILAKTPNLIIDIRGNGGGGDYAFNSIIPYLKTNPISTPGVDYLSTPLNNQRMLDFITKPEYKTLFTDEQKQFLKQSYDTLQQHVGTFVHLNEPVKAPSETTTAPKAYPRQVGIIIDGGVGSTAEQFLLAAKQSKKVKLFGITTYGALDIANMYAVKSPCNDYELGYGLSRSKRIPQYILDDRGIQPDYFISNETPGFKWIGYVKNILEQ